MPGTSNPGGAVKVHGNDGKVLDATFSVEVGPEIVFESRSGTTGTARARNVDYNAGLELILRRLHNMHATIDEIAIDSAYALTLDRDSRGLDLQFPIDLASESDIEKLRLQITRAQRSVARQPMAMGDGNNTKRIRLIISGLTDDSADLESLLALGNAAKSPSTQRAIPTIEAGQLYTHDEVNAWIGGNWRKGIRYSGTFPDIERVGVVIADNSPYHDDPSSDVIHYVGEGRQGDQTLRFGNRVLALRYMQGKPIDLFIQESTGTYRYRGPYRVTRVDVSIERDVDDDYRGAFIFALVPETKP